MCIIANVGHFILLLLVSMPVSNTNPNSSLIILKLFIQKDILRYFFFLRLAGLTLQEFQRFNRLLPAQDLDPEPLHCMNKKDENILRIHMILED